MTEDTNLNDQEQKEEPEEEEEHDNYDDPYIDEKRLDKRLKSWEKTNNEKIRQTAEEIAQKIIEKERQANFLKENKDFDKVMSQETLQKFANTYPEIAEGILNSMPNDFNRQKHVYQTIKSLKIHLTPEEQENIEDTIKKKQGSGLYQPSNVAPSPYKTAGDFSKQGQAQAYEQMEELASRFGGGGVRMP